MRKDTEAEERCEAVVLEDARVWLRKRLPEGARCPCCSQFAKVYQRRIYGSLAASFLLWVKTTPTGAWREIDEFTRGLPKSMFGARGDFAKLALWGLIEQAPVEDGEDARTSGLWRATELGRRWAFGLEAVPKFIEVYDGRKLRESPDGWVTIRDCLGRKFSYEELMARGGEAA